MREVTSLNNTASFDGNIKIRFKTLMGACLIWLVLPVVIFCTGYLKLYIGIPAGILFCALAFFALRHIENKDLKIPLSYFVGFIVLSVATAFVIGIGEYIYTLQDHSYRRAILNDLINYDWPVVYDYSTQTNPDVVSMLGTEGKAAFCYYFTYWMPAALIGKICGNSLAAGNFFLLIWTAAGIFLTFLAMAFYIGRPSLSCVWFYVFFGGLDLLPYIAHEITHYEDWLWLEGYVRNFSYISNFVDLGNVFNQCVPCFLITTLVLLLPSASGTGLIAGVMFAYSPWATIGILPIVAVKGVKGGIRKIFTWDNIVSAAALLFIFGSYYMSASGAVTEKGMSWSYFSSFGKFVLSYCILLLLEVVPYAIILWKREKKNPIFIACLITLAVIPLFKITYQNDLAMRGSMPALFALCVMMSSFVADIFEKDKEEQKAGKKRPLKENVKICALVLFIMASAFPAAFELFVVLGSTAVGDPGPENEIVSFGDIQNADLAPSVFEQFYVNDYEETFFFSYLASSSSETM